MHLVHFYVFNDIDELIKKSIVRELCYEFVSVKAFQRLFHMNDGEWKISQSLCRFF